MQPEGLARKLTGHFASSDCDTKLHEFGAIKFAIFDVR